MLGYIAPFQSESKARTGDLESQSLRISARGAGVVVSNLHEQILMGYRRNGTSSSLSPLP